MLRFHRTLVREGHVHRRGGKRGVALRGSGPMTSSARASLKSPTSARRYSLRRPLTPVPARRRRPRKVSVSSIGATAGAAGPGSCWGTLCCRGGCLRAIWRRMSSVMVLKPPDSSSGDAVVGQLMVATPTETQAFPHQADLPPLPVPTLEDTCARYLDSVRPLLSETELQHTEAVVAEVRHTGLSSPRQFCNSHV